MKSLTKILSLALLVLLINGCSTKDLSQAEKPKIDDSLEVVDSTSIRNISDINSMALEWKKVDDLRVNGYYIYRANIGESDGKLTRVAFVENRYATHHVDPDLEPNTKYNYAISSATKEGFESVPTNTFMAQTLPVLAPISYVQAISNMPRQIKVLWRPHESERVQYYRIERTTPSTAQWEHLKTLEGRYQVEYIDTNLKDNVVYMYRVIAVSFDDIYSQSSETVRAQTKPLPFPANNVRATNNLPKKIVVSWDSSTSQDVIGYNVYSSSSADGSFNLLKAVPSNVFTYEDVVNEDGKHRFYKVVAVDKDGLESALLMNATMGVTLAKLNKPIITLAQIQGEQAILNWLSGDSRAVSYIIYKTIKEGFLKSQTIKINGITDLRFEDRDIVRGVEYTYTLQSVDEYGIASEETQQVSLTLPKLTQN